MENQNQPNERPMIQNNYYGNIGQQINHVDKIEAHFDKDMGITVNGEDIMPKAASSPDEEWVDEIVACFMGDRECALEFVRMAKMMTPSGITDLVKAWVVQRKISELSYGRRLWKPLHDHGIYTRSESNWNTQVK